LSCFRGRRGFVNLARVGGSSWHPLASPVHMGACRTPRPSFYFFRRGLPLMSIRASPLESCALIYICLRQAYPTSVCRNPPEERQAKPLVAGAYRTPSALGDVGWRCLPAMPEFTFPRQFEFAAEIFCGHTRAPTSERQISHGCYAQFFMKFSPPVVTLPAPAPLSSASTFHVSCTCFPAMSVSAYPHERRTRVLVTGR
jgi:hypothetical protein